MANEKCTDCGTRMKITMLSLGGVRSEGLECPKCKDKVFTEKQAIALATAIDQKRLKEKYMKKPVIIGNSLGVIFPKDVVDVFGITAKKTKLDFRADKAKSKIEITVL